MNIHNYDLIPDYMKIAIDRYVTHGEGIGHFLTALFENDLMGAIGRADDLNMQLLPVYASYIWNKCPAGCHGSKEIVREWRKKKERENVHV